MFTLFIIFMIMGLGTMICEEINDKIESKRRIRRLTKYYNSKEYKMKKMEEELKEKEEAKETKNKDYDPMAHIYCIEQEFGVEFTNIPGTANKKTQDSIKNVSKIIDEATNAEKKIKELKEKQEKVLQRKKELEQLINDRMGKQITMDEWEKEIDKQNIIKEIKEQKEKEALNNGGIQMSLFEEETIVTEEEIKNYKHKQNEELIKDIDTFIKEFKERDKREAEEFMRNYINNNLPCQNSNILKDLYERRMKNYKSRYPELYFEIEIEDLDI